MISEWAIITIGLCWKGSKCSSIHNATHRVSWGNIEVCIIMRFKLLCRCQDEYH